MRLQVQRQRKRTLGSPGTLACFLAGVACRLSAGTQKIGGWRMSISRAEIRDPFRYYLTAALWRVFEAAHARRKKADRFIIRSICLRAARPADSASPPGKRVRRLFVAFWTATLLSANTAASRPCGDSTESRVSRLPFCCNGLRLYPLLLI